MCNILAKILNKETCLLGDKKRKRKRENKTMEVISRQTNTKIASKKKIISIPTFIPCDSPANK